MTYFNFPPPFPEYTPCERIMIVNRHVDTEKDGVNINLNLFLRLLGATNDIICDDQKTLEFMFEIKRKLEEASGEIKLTVDSKDAENEK
jgi:hypothetical protein